ncbi:MAG: hypothetical protein H0U49_08300, partial [Parachlamydiaceae bacterium]|nr:hypothetical protein [Parachlamydiaceae bacterium]
MELNSGSFDPLFLIHMRIDKIKDRNGTLNMYNDRNQLVSTLAIKKIRYLSEDMDKKMKIHSGVVRFNIVHKGDVFR